MTDDDLIPWTRAEVRWLAFWLIMAGVTTAALIVAAAMFYVGR